jgi:hypothetical protein
MTSVDQALSGIQTVHRQSELVLHPFPAEFPGGLSRGLESAEIEEQPPPTECPRHARFRGLPPDGPQLSTNLFRARGRRSYRSHGSWRTWIGTGLLISAALVHYANALWSIYLRRSLRLSHWEWWQLALGLCIPALLMFHVTATRIAEGVPGVRSSYSSVLIVQWMMFPWLGVVQAAAVLTVWTHACIGIHFWLLTKPWYPGWRPLLFSFGLMLPTLAVAGYITAGNQLLREARSPPGSR